MRNAQKKSSQTDHWGERPVYEWRQRGFTLIELLIVVAIIAIIAAIAFPSYQDQVRKSRRGEAKGKLMELAQRMETYYTENKTYAGATFGTSFDTEYYQVRPNPDPTTSATSFAVQSAPISGSVQENDPCGTLTLNNSGTQGVTGANAGITAADCW
ncbi:MAG: type IV pilin protein [Candidatus Competibacteraceae bacterium]